MAWDDEPWILDGAAVRISIVGFDDGSEREKTFDGQPCTDIASDLTSSVDITHAVTLNENVGWAFQGVTLAGPFDIPEETAQRFLRMPMNPNGRPNSDVVRPVINALDDVRHPRHRWVVIFGMGMPEESAALYEGPFEYVKQHVQPARAAGRSQVRDPRWWLHLSPRPEMRTKTSLLKRFIVFRASPNTACLYGERRCFQMTPSMSSPVKMTTSSASCTAGRTRSGRCGWERRWRIDRATRRPPASRPSPCRGRRAASRWMIRA
jgi:hypothetical protein